MLTFALILFTVISISLDAYSDAYIDRYKKRNHFTEVVQIAATLFVPIIAMIISTRISNQIIYHIVGGYVLLRIAIFNIIYNNFKGNKVDYLGSSDQIWDKPLSWILSKISNKWIQMIVYLVLLTTTAMWGLILLATIWKI